MKHIKSILTLSLACCALSIYGQWGGGLLINQTGFVNPNTGKLQSTPPPELTGGLTGSQLDNTGFVGDANLGQRINYSDGGWFQGIVRYGRRESGRLHHPDGTEDVGSFDANGYLHGLCATIWTNGVWYYGYHQNGQRHGDGSLYMNGCYYDQSYSYGTLISSVQVSSPRYNWPERERMISDARLAAQAANPQPSNSSDYKLGVDSKCGRCHGGGRIQTNFSVSGFGVSTAKKRCNYCNKLIFVNDSQWDICPICNGTGRK